MWTYKVSQTPDQLWHYASPYYDPVKAHEYYMRHRKLKGRRTGSAATLKEELSKEYQEEAQRLTNKANDDAADSKTAIQNDIATLRAKYKGMDKEERAHNKGKTQREIQRLRLQIKQERNSIYRQLGINLESLGSAYNQIYNEELGKTSSGSSKSAKKSASKAARTPISTQTDQTKKKNKTSPGGRTKVAETK